MLHICNSAISGDKWTLDSVELYELVGRAKPMPAKVYFLPLTTLILPKAIGLSNTILWKMVFLCRLLMSSSPISVHSSELIQTPTSRVHASFLTPTLFLKYVRYIPSFQRCRGKTISDFLTLS